MCVPSGTLRASAPDQAVGGQHRTCALSTAQVMRSLQKTLEDGFGVEIKYVSPDLRQQLRGLAYSSPPPPCTREWLTPQSSLCLSPLRPCPSHPQQDALSSHSGCGQSLVPARQPTGPLPTGRGVALQARPPRCSGHGPGLGLALL